MAVSELLLWSLSRRSWQMSLSVGHQCRLSLSFRRLLRFTGQSARVQRCVDHLLKACSHHITERRVPELIPVLGSQPAGVVSHKPGGRLPSLSARPAVTPATLNRTATNYAAW